MALPIRLGKADHDELLVVAAFDLEPVAAAAGPKGSVAALRDDTLDAVLAGMAEEIRATPPLVVAVAHHAVAGQNFGKARASPPGRS